MSLPPGVFNDVVEAIGNTPLIKLNRVTSHLKKYEILVKI